MSSHPWFEYRSSFEAIALIGSSGAWAVLEEVLSALPAVFVVPIVVLLHRRERIADDDTVVWFLSQRLKLKVQLAQAGCALEPGTVYVAPPDCHLLLDESRRFIVSKAFTADEVRPSGDFLLESFAELYGPHCIAVVLSGALNDGASGVAVVKAFGGTVLVQDPITASESGMPRAAISTGCSDFVLSPDRIADALTTLTMVPGAASLFLS